MRNDPSRDNRKRRFKPSQLPLFLAIAFCGYFLFWHQLHRYTLTQMRSAGFEWERIERHGFPLTQETRFINLRHHSTAGVWKMRELRIRFALLHPNRMDIEFGGTHIMTMRRSVWRITHSGNLAELYFSATTPYRGSAHFTAPSLTLQTPQNTIFVNSQAVTINVEPVAGSDTLYTIAMHSRALKVNEGVPFARFAFAVDVERDWINRDAQTTQTLMDTPININRLEFARKDLTIRTSGKLGLDRAGYLSGKLNLVIVNLIAFADILTEFGLVDIKKRAQIISFGKMAAAFSGETVDRITLPLHFQNGEVQLGPIPIATAPRLADLR